MGLSGIFLKRREDIDEIMKRPFDKNWCYKNPKDFL